MKLTGLIPLYKNMRNQSLTRTLFKIPINNAIFEVIYFIDTSPHKLAIGVRDHLLFFEIDVGPGFSISTYLGENYGKIYDILGLTPNGDSPFTPAKFYQEINQRIPTTASPNSMPKPREIAPYRRNVEEAEKIYFVGWLDNDKSNKNVRPENLEKTRLWLGEEAYQLCKQKNISSRWTDIAADERPYVLPESKN